jgi:hypothetical protein
VFHSPCLEVIVFRDRLHKLSWSPPREGYVNVFASGGTALLRVYNATSFASFRPKPGPDGNMRSSATPVTSKGCSLASSYTPMDVASPAQAQTSQLRISCCTGRNLANSSCVLLTQNFSPSTISVLSTRPQCGAGRHPRLTLFRKSIQNFSLFHGSGHEASSSE